MGRRFGWFLGAYGVSALGTWLAFGAFPVIAVQVLHAGPAEVALLSSAAALAGAAAAVPLGARVEHRRKRPVMVAADLVRCAALLTVPAGYALGALTLPWLLGVTALVATAEVTFRAASGAYLRTLLPEGELLAANARLEATSWTATAVGPPLGGALVGLLGPVATVAADAVSHLLSALGLGAIGGREPVRPRPEATHRRDLLDGWRLILADPVLRPLLLHTALFNGLVTATEPLLAVLMLGQLGFAPWQYGLAFALPSLGGLLGARLARPLAARLGEYRVLRAAGTLRALWPLGLVLVGPGTGGLVVVTVVELGLIVCCAVFNPLHATWRLRRTGPGHTVRVLTAWSVTTRLATGLLTAGWGVLGSVVGVRTALGLAGAVVLVTPLLLPSRGNSTRRFCQWSAVRWNQR
ncbi:MFS transporter [Kitasatospora sp. NPDC051853]|uniref:MFS transporter n=1 Tax=Kitasatospora sp. NPDC051853 TaxID=3364058 RepID=UPI0037BD4808